MEPGSVIHTDDWSGYSDLSDNNYTHNVMQPKDLTIVHLVASLLKRWILGTYQGAVMPSLPR